MTCLVKSLNDVGIEFDVSLDHAGQRIAEPVLEVVVRSEDCRHQEVEQRPQLHQRVLQWRAGQQQPSAGPQV